MWRRTSLVLALAILVTAAVAAVLTAGTLIQINTGTTQLTNPRSAALAWILCACLAGLGLAVGRSTSVETVTRHKRLLIVLLAAALTWILLGAIRPTFNAGDGLSAEYFRNLTWTGPPAMVVVDTELSTARMRQRWNGTPPEEFSVRWTGFLTIGRPGLYSFTTTSDDGSQLLVDNQVIVDNSGMHSLATRSGSVRLDRGSHTVVLRYVQFGAASVLDWSWSRDGGAYAAVPAWALSQQRTRYATVVNARIVEWGLWSLAILIVPATAAWYLRVGLRGRERDSAVLTWGAAAVGMVLRLVLSAASRGTNDIVTWEDFARHANQEGVLWMYENLPEWNHPPLTGYLGGWLLRLSVLTGLRFPVAFKLAPIAADALCLVLLWKLFRHRHSHFAAPLAAVAIFSFSPNAILVSAYHGNNDSLVALFVLAACYFIEEKHRFFWAGMALAAAVNVKLIPLVLAPVFLANVRRWPEAIRFCGGLSLGAIPFIPVMLREGKVFHRNAIAYNSNFENWGIPFLIRRGEQNPAWTGVAVRLHTLFVPAGRYLIVATILALCAWSRWRRPLSTYQLAAGGLAAFLFLAPGFGLQYTAIMGPVLVAASLGWGLWYALSAGAFIASVYYLFWTREALVASNFSGSFPYPSPWIGFVVWIGLLVFLLSLARAHLSRGARLEVEPPPG